MSGRSHSSSAPHHAVTTAGAARTSRKWTATSAAAEHARLKRASGVPRYASWLPPREYEKLAEHHARDTQSHMDAWRQTRDLMAAHTKQEMLRATGSTADSSRRYAAGSRGSAIQRRAPADCAHYQACAAVAPDNLNAHANRTLSTALHARRLCALPGVRRGGPRQCARQPHPVRGCGTTTKTPPPTSATPCGTPSRRS